MKKSGKIILSFKIANCFSTGCSYDEILFAYAEFVIPDRPGFNFAAELSAKAAGSIFLSENGKNAAGHKKFN